MHIENRGAIAALLVVVGIDLPSSFNLDQGAFDRAMDARKLERPHFDADALRFLATYDCAKDLATDIVARREEARKALGPNAAPEKVNAFEAVKARKLQELRDKKQADAEQDVIDLAAKAAQEEFDAENAPKGDPSVPAPAAEPNDNANTAVAAEAS
jgi:hypothetical protein